MKRIGLALSNLSIFSLIYYFSKFITLLELHTQRVILATVTFATEVMLLLKSDQDLQKA